MQILNLINLEKSDIKYHISKFPDEQQQVVINIKSLNNISFRPNLTNKVLIKSRLNNFLNLEEIICATKSLRNLGVKEIHLYTPYFLGARSDRQFEVGSNRYLADVICPIINSLNFESVTVLDAHSNVLGNLLNNFINITNIDLVYWSLQQLDCLKHGEEQTDWDFSNIILISPDAGASHKIYKLADEIGYKGDIITCSKERDTDGKLTKCVVPFKDEPNKDFIIIDDICDGGATFINIAKELKNNIIDRYEGKGKIYLIVTHGIFSKAYTELAKYFNAIYCTNSYKDIKAGDNYDTHIIKQINVF